VVSFDFDRIVYVYRSRFDSAYRYVSIFLVVSILLSSFIVDRMNLFFPLLLRATVIEMI